MSQAMVFSIAIVAGGALAACGDDNHDEVEAGAIELGTTRGQALQAQAAQDFPGSTDAEAIGKAAAVVFAINTGEMAQAHHVLSKSGNVAVRSLATRIIADHQASSATLQSLLGHRNLAPIETSVSRTLIAESNAGFIELQAGPRRIINIDYSQIQIAMHQEASVIVATVRDYMPATAIDIRGFLSDALSMLDQHLTRAETVLRDLP
jgi:predicted outer membrane protein